MSSECTECRLSATEMLAAASEHNYEGPWATVAVAASLLEVAAALWGLNEFLPWAFDQHVKAETRREPGTRR